jgi:cytoskeletal protein CcmA (bactofilin family)
MKGEVMKSIILITVVICLGCSISGCGGYTNSNNPQAAPSVAGNWQFTYVPSTGTSSTVSGTLTQTGSSFSGTMTITNSCATSGTISGTISGTSFTAILTETSPETITVTGTISSNYGSANGNFLVMSATGICASASGESGTWTGTHTTVSGGGGGGYGGIVRPADRMPVQLALNLKEDAGQVSGTAIFTNSACLHSVNVAGTLTGLNLELQGDAGTDGSVVLSGTTDKEGKILTLNSIVSGRCQGESGPVTLTKMQ